MANIGFNLKQLDFFDFYQMQFLLVSYYFHNNVFTVHFIDQKQNLH